MSIFKNPYTNLFLLFVLLVSNFNLYQYKTELQHEATIIGKSIKSAKTRLKKAQHHRPVLIPEKMSRLESGHKIKDLAKSHRLLDLKFKFSPEENLSEQLTKTNAEFRVKSKKDHSIFDFIAALDQSIPGLIFPQKFSMWQNQDKSNLHALYTFEWVTLK